LILPKIEKLAIKEEPGRLASPCHIPVKSRGISVKESRDGYAMLHFRDGSSGIIKNVLRSAHIAHYRLKVGDVPAGLVLDHLCENRKCCNPEHLKPVEIRENIRRGMAAKLSPSDVCEIKRLSSQGLSQAAIGRKFGVCQSHISRVVRGEFWAEGPSPWWQKYKRSAV
jgi:hypothetical protein